VGIENIINGKTEGEGKHGNEGKEGGGLSASILRVPYTVSRE
jgi:hypothetical protein